jgi:hypothetical protein
VRAWSINVFSGSDDQAFRSVDGKLPADLFLARLFDCVLNELIQQELREDGVFMLWLRSLTGSPEEWIKDGEGKPVLVIPRFSDDEVQSRQFWSWLWAMWKPGQAHACPRGWYLPLREDSLFILSTLLLLHHMNGMDRKEIRAEKDRGLEVRKDNQTVYLVHQHASIDMGGGERRRSRLILRVVVPDNSSGHSSCRWNGNFGPRERDKIRVGRQEMISAADLIREAKKPLQLMDNIKRLAAALRPKTRARTKPFDRRVEQWS